MSLRNTTAWLAVLVLFMMAADKAAAQRQIHHIPPFIDGDGADPDYFQPFIDGAFEHDFQFFAPPEFGEFGDGLDLNTGWFATADRVYIYLNRPAADPNAAPPGVVVGGLGPPNPPPGTRQIAATPTEGDWTWGNRFAIGYMTNEEHGWFMEHWHIGGPNVLFTTEAERVNILQRQDEINGNPADDDLRTPMAGMAPMMAPNDGVPRSDMNNAITGDRRYFIQNSVNNARLTSFELNKSIRLSTRHYGSVIEPFIGFRYTLFQDLYQRQSYTRITDQGVIVGQVPPTTVAPNIDLLQNELFVSQQSSFNNHLLGGQFGFRGFKTKGRWNLSSELRVFAFQNFQFQEEFTNSELTFYADNDIDAPVLGVFLDSQQTGVGSATEFVFGGEVRAQAAFEVTRDLSIRGGITALNLAGGIGRGNNILFNRQSVVMFGTTFGIDFRR